MKDIFLDTNLAHNLCNPMSNEYIEFTNWLVKEGALVLTNTLLSEYGHNQTLLVLINKLIIEGRTNKISTQDLKRLKFPKRIERKLTCCSKDRIHIKSIVLSNRKIGISDDAEFRKSVNGLPKFGGIQPFTTDCPTKIEYKTLL